MGRETRQFRQSRKSVSGDLGARNFSIMRNEGFHVKIWKLIKARGKNNGQS